MKFKADVPSLPMIHSPDPTAKKLTLFLEELGGRLKEDNVFEGGVNAGDCLVWKPANADNVAFAPIVPLGSRTVWDQDSAPLGWTRDTAAALNDRFMRLVTGVRAHGGSHTISGLAFTGTPLGTHNHIQNSHTHTMKNHTHTLAANGTVFSTGEFVTVKSVSKENPMKAYGGGDATPVDAANSTTGGPSDNTTDAQTATNQAVSAGTPAGTVSHDGSWRTLHRDLIMGFKDAV